MRPQLSNRQLMFLGANSIISASLVILPQFIIDLALQNAWLVPILLFLFIAVIISIGLFKIEKLPGVSLINTPNTLLKKVLAVLFFVFFFHVLIRDIRIILGFVSTTLIPLTPDFIIMLLVIGTILYLAWAGIEVIARFTELYFMMFIGVILFIPLSLGQQLELVNFEPILGSKEIPSILQSMYLGFSWAGEIIAVFLIIWYVKPLEKARKAVLWGGVLGLVMLFILVFCQIAVLGAEIVRYSTYPSYSLVQQIRLTEFLDRLDLILVAFYFPTIFAKMSFFLYGSYTALKMLSRDVPRLSIVPLAFLAGILSLILLENKGEVTNFAIFTWASFGLILELLLVVLTFFFIHIQRKGERVKRSRNRLQLRGLSKIKGGESSRE